jgi:hypothetical protein
MSNELILQVRNIDDLSFLEKYGNILFSDDIIDVVIIECDANRIPELRTHPNVVKVNETRKDGMLLEQKTKMH